MRRPIAKLLFGALAVSASPAQELASIPQAPAAPDGSANNASIFTRKDARTITLSIPAPRGPILDRTGAAFAQSRVAWQLGLQYEQFEKADRAFVVEWGRTRIAKAKTLVPSASEPTDDELWDHYQNRRWLPLLISSHLGDEDRKKIEPSLSKGLILHPVYQRYYPGKSLAAHIIGYTGSVGKLPTGPINFNEPMWEEQEGRSGFESIFNQQLTGQPGMKRMLYDENGRELLKEQVKRPRPGGAVVTTLNKAWQEHAEDVLRSKVRRGAFVLIDVNTGEVLVMASRPSFDLNGFVPGISDKDFKALNDDPGKPLVGRAFQSAYPPGSSFKPFVALTALNNGEVGENTEIYCAGAITLGGHTFHNHNKRSAGSINVKQALATSNNIWFGQIGMRLGAPAFLGVARQFGFGETTGLDLVGEKPGLVPTSEWMQRVHNRRFKDGDDFNLSIGQGSLEVTPLQVAQGMAGIANGGVLPKLHLVMQVQDPYGRVIKQAEPERRKWLGMKEEAIKVVRKGMRDVVDHGTGRSAGVSFAELCGKTGTAQWNATANLAWFGGFLPYDEPRFAFAAVYEGRPGENPSGGKNAAPIVSAFFEPLKDEFKEIIAPAPKALQIVEETGEPVGEEGKEEAEGGDSTKKEGAADEAPHDGVLKAQPVEPLDLNEETPPEDTGMHEIPKAQPVSPEDLEEGPVEDVPPDSTELPED